MPQTEPVAPQAPQGGGGGGIVFNDNTNQGGAPAQNTTSGGGGFGGGGGGGAGAAQANANTRRAFLLQLQELGIGLTGNLSQLVNSAVSQHYNMANFLYYLRKTKEYRQRFTGIFNRNGTLKMSEAQYLANERQYRAIASKAGINLGRKMMDWMFVHNVDPSEFADRALSVTRLRRSPALYNAFKAELHQSGIARNVTRKQLLRFILGRGNAKWYDLWSDTVTRNAATQAGLAVGRRNALDFLPQGLLERISGLGLSEEALNKGFNELADDIENTIPLSKLYGVGLTRADLVTLRFGGRGRNEIASRVAEITAQRNLSEEQKAQPQLYQTERGSRLNVGGLSGDEGE